MRVAVDYGREHLEVEIAEDRRIATRPPPAALTDPAAAVRAALEAPHGFPPLRRALTPDDRVAVVVDERLPRLVELLVPVLEHVVSAGVSPGAITLVCPPPDTRQPWVEDLPEAFEDVHIEVHDPGDRHHLSYLATMSRGKRLYLNRTVVEADQVVVLSGRRYDPLLGVGGAEGMIFPGLGDAETRAALAGRASLEVPGATAWPARQQAIETAWLLGAPFFVQVIEAAGDGVANVVGGTAEASAEGRRLLDAAWRQTVPQAADLVLAGLSGDPARHTFADLAAALACATRVVRPNGRIVLLSRARPELGPGADVLRELDEPEDALERLRGQYTLDLVPALQWATAASQARLYLLSDLPDETVEDLFAMPLTQGSQVQRLIDAGGSCLVLQDAHKAIAVIEESP